MIDSCHPRFCRALPGMIVIATFLGIFSMAWAQESPAERRYRLLQLDSRDPNTIGPLTTALEDENLVVRRTAARRLAAIGLDASSSLEIGLRNSDPIVRKISLQALCLTPDSERRLSCLARLTGDSSLPVRLFVVNTLAGITPRTDAVIHLLEAAGENAPDAVRQAVTRALWPFHRNVVLLRNRADWDHEVEIIGSIQLPKEDWTFHLDPDRDGHRKGWYEPAFADSDWKTIAIEQAWQKAGYDYIGVSWYRRSIDLPARPETVNAVEIRFEGVDECAWVWLNGIYVGEHDIGPSGWDKAFALDITDAVHWGEKNQITVRAMNTAHAGGIWKPVHIEILK